MRNQTVVRFGNPNPQHTRADGNREPHPILNQSTTAVEMWPGFDDPEFVELTLGTDNDRMLTAVAAHIGKEHRAYAVGVYECEQLMDIHAGGQKPDWVVCPDDPAFAEALSKWFGCPVGEPVALLTNTGRDDLHKQALTTGTQPAAFTYGALSANTGSGFASTDTTLAGEITTASGGLVRAQMTFAHTTGTNTSTLTKTWTANGSDSLPVTIASWAVFNAASTGDMGWEDALNATATLTASGDSITVTFTLTLG